MPILATKLYIPPTRPEAIQRPRLIERLYEGLSCKLTLISAPAGFGKTTRLYEWIAGGKRPAAWPLLDKKDNDPARCFTYLATALQTITPELGASLLAALDSRLPLTLKSMLTSLVNEIAALPASFILVLDDSHEIDSTPVDETLSFLLEYLPPQMHVVII